MDIVLDWYSALRNDDMVTWQEIAHVTYKSRIKLVERSSTPDGFGACGWTNSERTVEKAMGVGSSEFGWCDMSIPSDRSGDQRPGCLKGAFGFGNSSGRAPDHMSFEPGGAGVAGGRAAGIHPDVGSPGLWRELVTRRWVVGAVWVM